MKSWLMIEGKVLKNILIGEGSRNNFLSFFNFLFENGKVDWKKGKVGCFGCGRENKPKYEKFYFSMEAASLWVMKAFVFLSFLLVGYGRWHRQWLRRKEENERKNKWLISRNKKKKQFVNGGGSNQRKEINEINWLELMRPSRNDKPSGSAASPFSNSSFCVDKWNQLKKEDNCWNGRNGRRRITHLFKR